jgi:hypothetical protein
MPGRRKTQMWLKGFVAGRRKRKEVGEGAEEGVVMQGCPVGIWSVALAQGCGSFRVKD